MAYNTITLHGGQLCDYLFVSREAVSSADFQMVDSEPSEWTDKTALLSKFNDNLAAGNSDILASLNGYELRRKASNESVTKKIVTINGGTADFVIDYTAKSKTKYTYYLYPFVCDMSAEGAEAMGTPLFSSEISGNWNYWSLFVVDESEEDNVYYLNKMFKFELNLDIGDRNNNASVTITPNFTRYPTFQYGTANYWSGQLSSLCGYINCTDSEYIQTNEIISELKELTSDTRKKFLRDTKGNIYEISITSPISIHDEFTGTVDVNSVTISWSEAGDAKDVSIVNNPNATTTSWLLTDDGYARPYIEYVWDNNGIWDNSKIWTANNDVLGIDLSNLGRSIKRQGGDKL